MKSIYFTSFFILIIFFVLIALYFVDIPSPSRFIVENYKFEIK